MKKITSCLLALVLIFSAGISAYADADLQSMSYSELFTHLWEVCHEIQSREEWKKNHPDGNLDYYTVGETVFSSDCSLAIEMTDVEEIYADENTVYIIAKFLFENKTGERITINEYSLFECYIDDFRAELDFDARYAGGMDYIGGSILSGKKLTGCLAYTAPADWQRIEIYFAPDAGEGQPVFFFEKAQSNEPDVSVSKSSAEAAADPDITAPDITAARLVMQSGTVSESKPQEQETEDTARDYVLNTSSRKIHFPSCSSVDSIADHNREDVHAEFEDLTEKGYTACGRCNPS